MMTDDDIRAPLDAVLLELEPLLWTPQRLGQSSGWWGHVPFAHWLVAVCKPRVIVELGTHHGVSFAAFCEAVTRRGLVSRCHAVDLWQGDEHTGFYDDEVYQEVSQAFAKYEAFSILHRESFDQARARFPDGTIDLLHIDGLHTYEAVRHDYETWLPALSDRGIILFHDTAVRRGSFGVFRLWAEIRDRYPSFEFPHGNGLGVLLVGRDPPEPAARICRCRGTDREHLLQGCMAQLGEQWIYRERRQIAIDESGRLMETADAETGTARGELAAWQTRVRSVQMQVASAEAALALTEARLAQSEQREAALARSVAEADLRLRAIHDSMTWKAAEPLRRIGGRYPRAARLGRQALRLAWWTATGRLLARLRDRRDARRTGYRRPRPRQSAIPDVIAIPRWDEPVVSVIIPTHGNVQYTLRCLASIAANVPEIPFEVIVAEDNSGDPAIGRLRGVANITLIENSENLGFVRNCNAAARHATGEFVMFLNNDTEVCEGWLDSLVDAMRRRPDAGAVGSKLLYPDGRLQEAGGIIWDDGSGWNYGRLDDCGAPVYNYVRETDYVSAAALMIRHALFDDLGGFDTFFAPAYCEDSDLAFRIRARGQKVLYQPRSEIIHYEGISNGTDLTAGVKACQPQNQRKLAERWRDVLAREHFPPGRHLLRARDRARNRQVVLVIDHYVPEPDRDAGSRTMVAFIKALLQEGLVVKFWPDNGGYSPGYTEALQDIGVEVCYGPAVGHFADWIATNGPELDAVLLSRPETASRYIPYLRLRTRTRLIFYGHDLHCARMRGQAELTGDAGLARKADDMEWTERSVWQQADAVLYPSAEEAAAVAAMAPDATVHAVVPFAFEQFARQRAPVGGTDLVFVAGFAHPPNEDAAQWLCRDIFPLILAQVPSARLILAGSNPTEAVRKLASAHVSVTSNLSDAELAALYARARVAIVPLRFGAGVKLKVVEALKEGVPLVTTPVGIQGCPGLDRVVAVHAAPAELARAACRLLTDDTAWSAASAEQIAYARANFSQERLRNVLLQASGLRAVPGAGKYTPLDLMAAK